MKSIPTLDPEDLLPLPGIEYRLAHYLMGPGQDVEFTARVLEALMGRPHRYSELRPLLRGKSDNVLTVALRWLDDHGLVLTRGLAGRKGTLYELTAFGSLVLMKMAAFREAEAWQQYRAMGGPVHGEVAD